MTLSLEELLDRAMKKAGFRRLAVAPASLVRKRPALRPVAAKHAGRNGRVVGRR